MMNKIFYLKMLLNIFKDNINLFRNMINKNLFKDDINLFKAVMN